MNKLEKISDKVINSIGTPMSIVIHTFFFVGIFMLELIGFRVDQILLVLTTAVSLEAIYLAIFIQMSVNKTSKSLASVEKDIDEIQEDVDDIQGDVEDLGSDEENEMIKTIQDIEKRLTLLHKEIITISNKKN